MANGTITAGFLDAATFPSSKKQRKEARTSLRFSSICFLAAGNDAEDAAEDVEGVEL